MIKLFLVLSKYKFKEDQTMDIEIVAKALKELGHPTRLAIYKRDRKSVV